MPSNTPCTTPVTDRILGCETAGELLQAVVSGFLLRSEQRCKQATDS